MMNKIEVIAEYITDRHLLENISTCSASSSPAQYSSTIRVHDEEENSDEEIKHAKNIKLDTFSGSDGN